jgi:enoyl-CoA hydratase/carnithine racemase
MSTEQGVRLEVDGALSVVTIDRPDARNAIARATMAELAEALDEVERSDASLLVVTGGGTRVFVAGGDLKELAAIRTLDEASEMARTMRGVLDRLSDLAIPVLAAINGDAYGGGAEVAVACDMRVAADDVRCAFNQVALGIMPAWGGIERVTALLGPARALKLMSTGAVLSAREAFEQGLFDEVIERDAFEERWRELAAQIARAPRPALVGIKAAQRASLPLVRPELAEAAIASFAATWVDDDHWRMADEADQRRREASKKRS